MNGSRARAAAGLLDWRWLSTTVLYRAARYTLFQVHIVQGTKAPALISDQTRVPATLDNSNSISILSSSISDSTSNSTAAAKSHSMTEAQPNSKPGDGCMLCKEANNLRTPHRCATCGKVTCNFCSKQDPNSENEMHRVHTNPEKCSKTRLSSQHFVCPHCEESFTTTAILQVHMAESHPEGFESVMGISQMSLTSNNSSQSIPYVPCKLCDKVFYNETDSENHRSRVHDFGEYFNLYPCDECGFRAGDVKESLEHRKNHRNVGEERRTRRSISSHRSYVIEDGDLVV